ncbi:DUF475 domain-containing protein [Mycobacterium tuberculosis]
MITTSDQRGTVLIAGLLGMVTYLSSTGSAGRSGRRGWVKYAGRAGEAGGRKAAGCALFLYLEVLDAAFDASSPAITTDLIIIAPGLGAVGAMFVRSITIYLVRQDTLDRYVPGTRRTPGDCASSPYPCCCPSTTDSPSPSGLPPVGVVLPGGVHRECAAHRLTVRSPTKFGLRPAEGAKARAGALSLISVYRP